MSQTAIAIVRRRSFYLLGRESATVAALSGPPSSLHVAGPSFDRIMPCGPKIYCVAGEIVLIWRRLPEQQRGVWEGGSDSNNYE